MHTFISVEFYSKPTNITHGVSGPAGSSNSGETYKDRSSERGVCKDTSTAELLDWGIQLEVTMGTGAAGVDYSLGDAFMVD